MSQSNPIHVTVSVDDAHLGKIDEVVGRLRAAGLEAARSLGAIGAITGQVDNARLAGLSKVLGVAAVEQERRYQLPPPDAKVQ